MKLLIDIGNSRLKWGYFTHNALRSDYLDHQEDQYLIILENSWKQLADDPEWLILSCVGRKEIEKSVTNLAERVWPEVKILSVKTTQKSHGVVNGYRRPERLGVDRWLALIAAHNLYQQAVCIVDLGTAITMDWMNESGRHLGGVICPGLAIMKQSVNKNTANLPMVDYEFSDAIADNTEAAIYSGTLCAAIGLINYLYKKNSTNSKLILTGGDAQLIAPFIEFEHVVEPHLIFYGLALMIED